jgi:serine/threonine protein phosphatase PrpC
MSLQFVAQCSAAQQQQRYEDVLLQAPAHAGDCCSRSFSCWALLDGHNGDTVARFLGGSLLPELESRLPAMPLPQDEPEQYVYADAVRRAVTAAFLSLSLRICELTGGTAAGCGAAAAVVVQTGHLLTVANAGSSKCVLDVGHCAVECSADHRLGNNEDEEERLDAGGCLTAASQLVHFLCMSPAPLLPTLLVQALQQQAHSTTLPHSTSSRLNCFRFLPMPCPFHRTCSWRIRSPPQV